MRMDLDEKGLAEYANCVSQGVFKHIHKWRSWRNTAATSGENPANIYGRRYATPVIRSNPSTNCMSGMRWMYRGYGAKRMSRRTR